MNDASGSRENAGGSQILPAVPKRFILIHYHIFKNAGSTIEYALERAFGKQFVRLHGPRADSLLDNGAVTKFLAGRPEIVAVSSHHLLYPKPVDPGFVFFDLCFLRDPLQRLQSVYKYLRRVAPVDGLGYRAKEMDLAAFLDLLVREHPQVVNDVQVNMLANGGVYTRPPSRTDLQVALDNLRTVSVLGVVDLFDESLVAAEYFLRPAFPNLQFQYVKQNVSPTDGDTSVFPGPLEERLGAGLHAQLRRLNELDYALLDSAKNEVLRRLALLPSPEKRLADFASRCETLRLAHESIESVTKDN